MDGVLRGGTPPHRSPRKGLSTSLLKLKKKAELKKPLEANCTLCPLLPNGRSSCVQSASMPTVKPIYPINKFVGGLGVPITKINKYVLH